MYLGIDFLITSQLRLVVSEVNVGLPGGAHEYNLTHLVHLGRPSDIFQRIEETSQNIYGKPFDNYLHSLPFVQSLKVLKIWMDGMGPLPEAFHPGLRLEDKWNQFQLLHSVVPMPKTMIIDPDDLTVAERFLTRERIGALKRRVGRGGRGFQIITALEMIRQLDLRGDDYLLQEYIESKVSGFSFSIRAIAFGGEFMCMYANLAKRPSSNHGFLTFVSPGSSFELKDSAFSTQFFSQRSWEAAVWFGENDPPYLRHNLCEEEVSETALILPETIYREIIDLSIRIERAYEGLDLSKLPVACFEARNR